MYQSNQARVNKEKPSLLLDNGQMPPARASSRPRSPSRCHNIQREQYPQAL